MELIPEPTNEFNKTIFFECLEHYKKPISIKCLDVSDISTSNQFDDPTIFLNLEILSEFPINRRDGEGNIIKINPLHQIISIPYAMKKTDTDNIYKISNKSNLFPLLNQALKNNEKIPPNNTRGFNISLPEIQENITGQEFKVYCKLQTENTKFKPYYKLEIAKL